VFPCLFDRQRRTSWYASSSAACHPHAHYVGFTRVFTELGTGDPSDRYQLGRNLQKKFFLIDVMGFDKKEVGGLSVKVMYI